MYIDNMKRFAKNEKELVILAQIIRIYSQDAGMDFSIKMCHADYEKGNKTNSRRNRTAKSRKNQNAWSKGKYM